MTINSETRVAGPFEGNDSTVTFPFAFKVFDSDELLVVRSADAVETVLVLGSDYSVALNPDQNAAPGGSITLSAPLATGSLLTATSDLQFLQPLDLTNQGGFYPGVINNAFDRVTILLQQLKAIADRTLKFPLSDGQVGDLPGRAERAGSVLAFHEETGEPVVGPNIAAVGSVADAVAAISIVAPHVDAIEIVAANVTDVTNFSDVYYGPSATDPTTRRDGSPLQPGDLYFNTELNDLRSYSGSQWFGGVTGLVTVQNLSGDGVQTEFLLDYAPGSEIVTQIFIHGVYQQKNTYEIGGPGGDLLIFDSPPPVGVDNIEVVVTSLAPTDDVLRNELADTDGVELVTGAYRKVATFEALRNISKTKNDYVRVVRPGAGSRILNLDYALDPTDTTTADDNGLVVVAADGGRWKLAFERTIDIKVFGMAAGSDMTAAVNSAAMALYQRGGGEVIIGENYSQSGKILMLPHVTIRGTGSGSTPRIAVSFTGAAYETTRPAGWIPTFCIDSHVCGLTLAGPGIASTAEAFSIRNAMQCSVRLNEIALFGYAFRWNKGTTSEANMEQSFFNIIEQNFIKPCGRGHFFQGAANRNTISTNSIADANVAYDFGGTFNYSETNTFINENIEGCRSWAEWPAGVIYSQTWVGICIENPSSNPYVCLVKDPGRQVFVNLSLIPLGDASSISMFSVGGAKPSMVLGSAASSGTNRLGLIVNEPLKLHDQAQYWSHHASTVYTGTIPGNSFVTVSIPLALASLNDRAFASSLRPLLGCTLNASAQAGGVTLEIVNGTSSNVTLTSVEISVLVTKFL